MHTITAQRRREADTLAGLGHPGIPPVYGWGFDDVVGRLPYTFNRPKAIQIDPRTVDSKVWVVHEDKLGLDGFPTGLPGGAVTLVGIASAAAGQVSLDPGSFGTPGLRDLGFGIFASIGSDQLTGVPVDIAFDNQRNRSALTNFGSLYSAGVPVNVNGKSLSKPSGGAFIVANTPRFMFLAIPNAIEGPGVVDVIEVAGGVRRFDTNPYLDGIQSIQAPGVNVLMDYYRQ